MMDNGINNNAKMKWWISWPAIVLFLILFWPVGLFLLWRRTTVDRKAMMISGKLLKIGGWILIAFVVLVFLVCLSEGFENDDPEFMVLFILMGISFLLLGKKIEKNSELHSKYILVVVNQGVTSLNSISNIMNRSLDKTKKDIQRMINEGFFPNAYINDMTQEIVMTTPQQNMHKMQSQNKSMKVVVCQSCGANNSIPEGEAGECEFCGSILK